MSKSLIVQKYGGTSVGTLERIEHVADRIVKARKTGVDIVVVVSAMAGETDKLLKIILFAGVFELLFKHNTPKNVVISEYVGASEFFLERAQIKFLNAILDKISNLIRK